MIDFELNESQKMILSSLEKSLDETFDIRIENKKAEGIENYNHGWDEIKKLGFMGILSSESNGGLGLSFFDFSLTLECWGSKLCDGPYIENSILIFILEQLEDNNLNNIIQDIVGSKKIITNIVSEQFLNKENIPVIHKKNNNYFLDGEIKNLPYLDESTDILTLALLDNEKKLIILNKENIDIVNENRTITGQKLNDINLEKFEITKNHILDSIELDLVETYVTLFTLAKCSESVGIASSILSMTNEYLKSREQFNKPLGSFQAIQHLASDIYIKLSETRELIRYCSKLSFKNKKMKKYVSLSKLKCDEELSNIAWTSHQLHGAIGFTWDYGLHLMTRKLLLNKSLNGDSLFHSEIQFI
tara:strand:- start:6752 stop:7831 length:1080 start_codon:yes stop_codon:yes gene_type:complete